jgi:hypothetical protein
LSFEVQGSSSLALSCGCGNHRSEKSAEKCQAIFYNF